MLKSWDSFYFQQRYTPDSFQAKEEYYRLANDLFNWFNFETELERKVWTMHCSGVGSIRIAKSLKEPETKVYNIIKRLRKNVSQKL